LFWKEDNAFGKECSVKNLILFHLNVFSLATLVFLGERYIVFPQGGMGTSKMLGMGLESRAIWGGMGKQKKKN
jgi:hypothetical protein